MNQTNGSMDVDDDDDYKSPSPVNNGGCQYRWYWKDKNNLHGYSDDISQEIDKLQINDSYPMFAHGQKYQITKVSKDKATQTNVRSNFSREVIRKISVNVNTSFAQSGAYSNSSRSKPAAPCRYGHQCRNWKNGNCQYSHDDMNDRNRHSNDDEKRQSQTEKWYYEGHNGEWAAMPYWLCAKLSNLIIGEPLKQKIGASLYEFKKTNIGKGTQRNTQTNKTRQIRLGEYGWHFEANNKSLKPMTSEANTKLNHTAIGGSFTITLGNTKYLITKISKNQAKQKNLSTNFERNVVLKLRLPNKPHNDDSGHSDHKHGGDWVKKRYGKAMKTGKMDTIKLEPKRTLKEDMAETIFRTCESQFMRSCQNMGGGADGLNKTITEVQYVINPPLIKKFQAKKKQLMAKHKCKENGLNIILAWHGTAAANVQNIVTNNFSLAKLGAHTGNKGAYGAGIYFSEFAKVSGAYGDGLMLCKVILGKQYQMTTAQAQVGRSLEPGYDSHVVVSGATSKYGQEVVIFDVDQILPCYIIKY